MITGKGGVGKSTLAASLGPVLARAGRRVLLLETDPRESLYQLLEVPPSGGTIVEVLPGLFLQNLDLRAVLDQVVRERVRLGLIADHWSQLASAQMRYVGEIAGPEFMRRLSDGVLRASGLSIWTQAGRWAFGMEFMGSLADHAKLRFADLPDGFMSLLFLFMMKRKDPECGHQISTFLN